MKIIYRLDTDDQEKLKDFSEAVLKNQEIVIPQDNDMIKISVVSDTGEVTEIK